MWGETVNLFLRVSASCQLHSITRLRNDYPALQQPLVENERIVDVQEMAISRGIAKRGLGQTTLAALCQKGGVIFQKKRTFEWV